MALEFYSFHSTATPFCNHCHRSAVDSVSGDDILVEYKWPRFRIRRIYSFLSLGTRDWHDPLFAIDTSLHQCRHANPSMILIRVSISPRRLYGVRGQSAAATPLLLLLPSR